MFALPKCLNHRSRSHSVMFCTDTGFRHMLLGASQMVAYSYNLETHNDFARIMAMLAAVQSVRLCFLFPLALHNLCKSEDKLLSEMRKGSQLGPAPEDAQVLWGQGEGCHEATHPSALLTARWEQEEWGPTWGAVGKACLGALCFTLSHRAAAMWRPCPRFVENQASVTGKGDCSSHMILDGNLALSFMPKPGSAAG